jgi:hypothetical protein
LRLAGDGCWSVRQEEEGGGAGRCAGGGCRCCWDAEGDDEEVEEETNIWWWLLTSSAMSVREFASFNGLRADEMSECPGQATSQGHTHTTSTRPCLAPFPLFVLFLLLSGIEVPREALWGGKLKVRISLCLCGKALGAWGDHI